MARATKIDKQIEKIDSQIAFLTAVRAALVEAQGKPKAAAVARKKRAPKDDENPLAD
jgi:hypothetical protein